MPLRLFDNRREVATSTIFHEDVKNASIAVDESIVISYNIFMMKVFKDITRIETARLDAFFFRI